MAERRFTLDDMLRQFREIRKMGIVKDVFAMIPGMREFVPRAGQWERDFERYEAILSSMTDEERADPSLFEDEPVRRSHVAERAGTSAGEVDGLLGLYRSLQKLIVAGGPEGLVGPGTVGFPGPSDVPGPEGELN